MPIMTEEARRRHVDQALSAWRQRPSSEQHTHPIPWRGGEKYLPVVDIPLDLPLLNADSHRIRAELESPQYAAIRAERYSDSAQTVLTSLWKTAHRKYEPLKESLQVDGQTEPGVMTRAGIMWNGNTRLVALRELHLPDRQWIRVAVLDSDTTPAELAQLELKLQIRDPLRDPYKLSNELLFVEEMSREYSWSDEQVAASLGWNPTKPAIGRKKVEHHRRLLHLIREMQQRDTDLPILFFDDKHEQLKALEQRYSALLQDGRPDEAIELLDTWILVARSGFSSVHQIRAVTSSADFVEDYLVPRLGDQLLLGRCAEGLLSRPSGPVTSLPGLDDLDSSDCQQTAGIRDLSQLIDIAEKPDDALVTLPGELEPVAVGAVRDALQTAIKGAIQDRKLEDRADDALNAPIEALRRAVAELKKACRSYAEVRGTTEFARHGRAAFEYELKHMRKQAKALEQMAARPAPAEASE